jgi:V8-like Glu-specific endopeptidase
MSAVSSEKGINKSIYSPVDPRKNLYELDVLEASEKEDFYPDLTKIKMNALATACLIHKDVWKENVATNSYSISLSTTLSQRIINRFGSPLKEGEKFGDEPSIAIGSGFLVSPNKLMTAGHCVSNSSTSLKDIKDFIIIFNFHMENKSTCHTRFPKTEVYRIKRVIYHQFDPRDKMLPDWALIKLDRKVVGIEPLQIQHTLQKTARVYMLGHPWGIPLKFSGEAGIQSIAHAHKFECDLPAFEGNSGSPVIDRATHAVIGILVNGNKDYEIDKKHKKCTGESRIILYRVTEEDIDSFGYELCQKITPLMLDPDQIIALEDRIIAKKGRAKRKKLSNANSEAFVRSMIERINWATQKMLKFNLDMYNQFGELKVKIFEGVLIYWNRNITAKKEIWEVSGIWGSTEDQAIIDSMKLYEKTRLIYGGKINLLEAKNIHWVSRLGFHLSNKDKIAVARNITAYNLSKYRAIDLHYWETEFFKKRYSPDKILQMLNDKVIHEILLGSDNKRSFRFSKKSLKEYLFNEKLLKKGSCEELGAMPMRSISC